VNTVGDIEVRLLLHQN